MSAQAITPENIRFALTQNKGKVVITTRKILLVVFFFISLYPYSLDVGGQGVSANYFFVLLPLLWCLLRRGVIKKPKDVYLLLIGLFSLIFVVAAVYQPSYLEYADRRIVSFVLFLSIFSYMFIKIDAEMVSAFKIALVGISLYFSLDSLIAYVSAGGANLGDIAINAVRSQRLGFIYVLAIWIVFQEKYSGRLWKICKYPMAFVLLIGLLLTFTRSSIVAILGSFAIFGLVSFMKSLKRPARFFNIKTFASILVLAGLVFSLIRFVPGATDFYEGKLQFLLDVGALHQTLDNPESSEGYRLFMLGTILDFVQSNPLTGSGYLGVWILFDDSSGSAHNQYTDVLFRTGLIGFAAYLYLLFALLRYLYANERALFWGGVGVILYGFFHETFKESQGAFVLAFLLGLMAQRRRWQPESIQHRKLLAPRYLPRAGA